MRCAAADGGDLLPPIIGLPTSRLAEAELELVIHTPDLSTLESRSGGIDAFSDACRGVNHDDVLRAGALILRNAATERWRADLHHFFIVTRSGAGLRRNGGPPRPTAE